MVNPEDTRLNEVASTNTDIPTMEISSPNKSEETPDVITPNDDTPVFQDWNKPVKRQAPSKEQQEKMKEILKFNALSPQEKLKQLLEQNSVDIQTESKPEPEPEYIKAETHPVLEQQSKALGIKDTEQEVIDTDPRFDLSKPIHNPGANVSDIKKVTTMSAKDLTQNTESKRVEVLKQQGPVSGVTDAVINTNNTRMQSVHSSDTSSGVGLDHSNNDPVRDVPRTNTNLSSKEETKEHISEAVEEHHEEKDNIQMASNNHSSDVPIELSSTDKSELDSGDAGAHANSTQVHHSSDGNASSDFRSSNVDKEQTESEQITTETDDASSSSNSTDSLIDHNADLHNSTDLSSERGSDRVREVSSADNNSTDTDVSNTHNEENQSTDGQKETLADALLEIQETTNPYAVDDISDNDFDLTPPTAKVQEKIEETPQEEETVQEDDDGVLTKQVALSTIANIYDTAVFGEQSSKMIFDPADMDIKVDNEIARAHIVLTNMTNEERLHYVLQTNSQALEQTAKNLYGSEGEFYTTTREALLDLAENVIDSDSYINRVHNSSGQFGNPATSAKEECLKKAKKDFTEKYPDKPFKMSRNVKIKGAGPDGSDLLVDHKLADKKKLFEQITENGVASIKGSTATKITSLLINGYRQVNFYHSGFHVNLNAPRMDQLSRYYNRIGENMVDYGRIMGQYAYLPIGVETRAALMDLFCECVESSNLKGYENRNTLMKALSVLDQPVAIWAMASLMYPKGVEVEYLCHNNLPDGKKCRHVEKAKVDINSMCYNDWSKLSAEAIVYTVSKEARTLEDLDKYRSKYLKTDGTTFPINKSEEWKAQFVVPSCFDAEEKQRAYVAEMAKSFQLSNLQKADDYFRSKLYLAYLPFVKKVMYVEDGKTVEFEDPSALEPALNNLQLVEGITLPQRLVDYMNEKTMTHICFTYMPCPVCGKFAPEAIDRLIPCDPEYTFFVWTAARLQS